MPDNIAIRQAARALMITRRATEDLTVCFDPLIAYGEDVLEQILVGIAEGLSLNFIRIFGGNRFQPSTGVFEFVRSVHELDCTMRWDNGVTANVLFDTESNLSIIFVVFRIRIWDADTTLEHYRRELTALARVARDVSAAIDGDLTRLSDFGRLFDRRLG